MAIDPETNKIEFLKIDPETQKQADNDLKKIHQHIGLLRPDGTPVPKHWSVFKTDELVVVKNYTFRVAHLGESYLVLEPVKPVDILKEGK